MAEKQKSVVEEKRKEPIAVELAKRQREVSVSEFFEKNRHLLGFDNKRKALLMTVKEAVDNSLDACEEAGILPELSVEMIDLGNDRFRVIIEDNGPGIVKKQIPNIFAKLLYGSKFHSMKQARGQQGIGISAAVLYSQLTTGKPAKITSKISPKSPAQYYELHIDTQHNNPEIVKEEAVEWAKEHGTRIELDLEAAYQKGSQSVDEYLKQTAIANPHTTIIYTTPKAEQIIFARATEEKPVQAKEIKPHPAGVELGILLKMLKATAARSLQGFLTEEFSRVGPGTAKEICENAALLPATKPHEMSREQAEQLMRGIAGTKLIAPPTDCLSPIGEELIEKGLKKEINAEFYCSVSRTPAVYRGNPFIIESGVAYGGDLPKESRSTLLRFANRVPLLYQEGACATTDAISEMNWKSYSLQQSGNSIPVGPLVIMVHMASVWVPFTSESKEAIAHYEEIIREIKLALQECGRKLAVYINRKKHIQYESAKRGYIETYIPHVGIALKELLALKDSDIAKVESQLKEILEKKRGKLEKIEMENLEYDQSFAAIGREADVSQSSEPLSAEAVNKETKAKVPEAKGKASDKKEEKAKSKKQAK
ncbi:DNA topoisomerase VI subunit B [Candidatus Woesearchaeota archaeon]|nr:DNA topoisomerase VI subunit B [Candidatus Woesearchaeota archaeon]